MADIFADTSGWANYFVRSEPYHALAKKQMQHWQSSGVKVITSNLVLIELIALFTSPLHIPRADQVQVIETIQASPWIEIAQIDPSLQNEAWDLLKTRLDKEWSFVDCASFVVMKNRGISEALTTDHHFEQAGFVCLLK